MCEELADRNVMYTVRDKSESSMQAEMDAANGGLADIQVGSETERGPCGRRCGAASTLLHAAAARKPNGPVDPETGVRHWQLPTKNQVSTRCIFGCSSSESAIQ